MKKAKTERLAALVEAGRLTEAEAITLGRWDAPLESVAAALAAVRAIDGVRLAWLRGGATSRLAVVVEVDYGAVEDDALARRVALALAMPWPICWQMEWHQPDAAKRRRKPKYPNGEPFVRMGADAYPRKAEKVPPLDYGDPPAPGSRT